MKKVSTNDLRKALTDAESIETFLSENEEEFSSIEVSDMLADLFSKTKISKSTLAKEAGISEVYLHQIFSRKRTPSRNRLLSICLALNVTLNDAQELLQKSGYASLYPRNKRDSIIMYALLHGIKPDKVNDMLFKIGEDTLF